MRTTLDIDEDVLAAVKELAKARKITAGEVISELARRALTRPADQVVARDAHSLVLKDGWYLLPPRGGTIVTNDLVERLLDRAMSRMPASCGTSECARSST
jgi:hypothetical protein